jgi:hypothetical protein
MPVSIFNSVSHMLEQLRLPESKLFFGWRLTNPEYGQIEGLPLSRGQILATDGMRCIILRADNSVFFGHIHWWIADDPLEQPAGTHTGTSRSNKKSKTDLNFSQFDL